MGPRLVRLLLGCLLVAGVAVVLQARPAAACGCVHESGAAASLQRATSAFEGRVTDVDQPWWPFGARQVTLQVDVDRVFKGSVPTKVTVKTAESGASCGLGIDDTGRFVFFSRESGAVLQINSCEGLVRGRAPASFGAGEEPAPGSPWRRPPLGSMIIVLGAGVAVWRLVRLRARRRHARD